jgi:hypothetical protein
LAGRSPAARWGFGLGSLLLGGLLLLAAAAIFLRGREQSDRGPRKVKADELRRLQDPESLPDPWVAYTAPKTFDPMIRIQRGRKRRSLVKYIVLQVEDRWLLACIPPDFVGSRVEGRLTVWSGPHYNLLAQRVHSASPAVANRLLPYHLDAEYDYGINTRLMTVFAAFLGVIGAAFAWGGLMIACGSPRPPRPQPGPPQFSVRPS